MDTYIKWNMPNWITVFLMVAVGYAVLGLVSSGIRGATS